MKACEDMKNYRKVLCLSGNKAVPIPSTPKHKEIEKIVFYNYFCLKMGCFQAFFGTEKGVIKDCPNCYQNDKVVGRFEAK